VTFEQVNYLNNDPKHAEIWPRNSLVTFVFHAHNVTDPSNFYSMRSLLPPLLESFLQLHEGT